MQYRPISQLDSFDLDPHDSVTTIRVLKDLLLQLYCSRQKKSFSIFWTYSATTIIHMMSYNIKKLHLETEGYKLASMDAERCLLVVST